MQTSIIIVSYNNSKVLRETIISLHKNIVYDNFEIIVVDNASVEDNVSMIKNEFPEIILIINNENIGFGRANNIGAKKAKGEYLFFVNGDIILNGNPFEPMLEFYRTTSNIGLLGAQLLNNDLSKQPSFYNFPSLTKRVLELTGLKKWLKKFHSTYKERTELLFSVQAIKGAFFLISKEKFELFGMFDEFYFMYVEDVDLSYKAIKNGYKNYLFNNDMIVHLGENHESVENLFLFENRNRGIIHFYKKNYSQSKFIIYILINLMFFLLKYFNSFIFGSKTKRENYRSILHLYKDAFIKSK